MTLQRFLPGQGETILIVDDESVTRLMVRKVLEESDYRVVEAQDGVQALERVQEGMPELILLDVRMPRLNGFDTCRALRQQAQGRHVPILMLTGLDDVVAVQLAFEAGATDFITKPINWALLAQRLRYALHGKQQEDRLRESEARLVHAQRLARLGHWRYHPDSRTLSLSPGLLEQLGFDQSSNQLPVAEITQQIYHRDRLSLLRCLMRTYRHGKAGELEFRLTNLQANLCTLRLYAERVAEGPMKILQGTLQDVTAHIEAEARISYFAHYDRLTDLPNRVLFWDRLTQSITDSRNTGKPFAVMLVDLDRFAALNASIGHERGDRVLHSLAKRMAGSLRASDTLSRIAGDEFAIICHNIEQQNGLSHVLSQLMACFAAPIQNRELDVYVSASIGIALYPVDGAERDTLLMHADVAKGRAKQLPGTHYQFYTPAMGETAKQRIAMEAALRRGLQEQAFVLHYQPLLNLRDRGVWGVEVLLRWQCPELGLVLPNEFIPLLGEVGLLQAVGEWTLRRACEEMQAHPFLVSVNLSPMQFGQDDLVERVLQILHQTAFPPARLQLEITEDVFIDEPEQAKANLEALRRAGIQVAIDDFGTGFSSLAYLKQFSTDFLKIDRLFIGEMHLDQANKAIVSSTIKLGHDLGMGIIGEGVEHTEELEFLAQMGCDLVQGFLFARPLSLAQLNQWLADR